MLTVGTYYVVSLTDTNLPYKFLFTSIEMCFAKYHNINNNKNNNNNNNNF